MFICLLLYQLLVPQKVYIFKNGKGNEMPFYCNLNGRRIYVKMSGDFLCKTGILDSSTGEQAQDECN